MKTITNMEQWRFYFKEVEHSDLYKTHFSRIVREPLVTYLNNLYTMPSELSHPCIDLELLPNGDAIQRYRVYIETAFTTRHCGVYSLNELDIKLRQYSKDTQEHQRMLSFLREANTGSTLTTSIDEFQRIVVEKGEV